METGTQRNLAKIDELWDLHKNRDRHADFVGRCLAFAVDPRYLPATFDPEVLLRVGVSFGDNPFTPNMAVGFVPPPVLPGRRVFGIHLLGSKNNNLTVYDVWMDAREAEESLEETRAAERARDILVSLSDEEYLNLVRESRAEKGPLQRSPRFLFDSFEVVAGEAF